MSSNYKNKIAITTGDPNGIGAEITIKALKELDLSSESVVLISNREILNFYGDLDKDYEIIEIPYNKEDIMPGMVTALSGEFSYQSLKTVCQIKPAAIVTAPVAKNSLYMAGEKFNGQTEILQKYLAHDNQKAEMLFIADDFRVLLLTRHCALKDVNITTEIVVNKVEEFIKNCKRQFGLDNLNIALCGFNPHAGEDGILGREELDILIPSVDILRDKGINITYPKPSDTLFVDVAKAYYNGKKPKYDCYIANYHDQGLIPIKTIAGEKTVNTTIGLDILRTSPGHGTAFDIAGKNIASAVGMIEAIKLAMKFK